MSNKQVIISANTTEEFIKTSQVIINTISLFHTKQDILAYLNSVKDYVSITVKQTRTFLKGYK
jgi:hypothetical protein